jgi:branched-chain amino acid transport system substrate-binding protein
MRALALTLVLPLLPATACTAVDDPDDPDIIIGASLELTGPLADMGKAYENALRLQVEQINEGRGTNARKVTLRIQDNRGEPATAATQINQLASDSTVTAIVTGWCSECVIGAAKTINDKRVPTIALAPSSEVSTPVEERRHIFKLAPNVNHDASALVSDLLAAGMKSVRFMATTDAYGRDAQEAMIREATIAGLKDRTVSPLATNDTNYGEVARTITQAKPDAVVIMAYPNAAGAAVRALREAGYRGRLALDASAAGPLFLTGASSALDGASLVFTQTLAIDDVIATTPANAARKQWFQNYTARYGGYQASASFAADAVQLIVNAVDNVGSATDRDGIRSALETVRIDGLSGAIRLTPSDHSGLMPQSLTMLVARNGRWRLS